MFGRSTRYPVQRSGLLCAIAVAALLSPSVAAAKTSVVLDQKQTSLGGGLSVRMGASQTITAGRTGLLIRVDIPLCITIKRSTVRLSVTAPATGRSAHSASATLTFSRSLEECTWQTMRFSRPIAVRAGEVVRMVLSSVHGQAPLWGTYAHQGNPYPRGSGHWLKYTIRDFGFRTYVQLGHKST